MLRNVMNIFANFIVIYLDVFVSDFENKMNEQMVECSINDLYIDL